MTDPAPQPAHPVHPREPAGQVRFGAVGAGIAVAGGALLVVALTVVDWYRHDAGDSPSHVSDIRAALNKLDGYHAANPVAGVYFGWLAWVLLVLVVITAVLANAPGSGSAFLRWVAMLVALGGLVVTLVAVKLTAGSAVGNAATYNDYLKQARLGFYLALAGFLLAGFGALIAPRRAG